MLPESVRSTWEALDLVRDETPRFDPDTLSTLPVPASRWLTHVLPVGAPLRQVIELEMTGRIKLANRWTRFRATQILRAGMGFVWKPVVGGRLLRFVGADLMGPNGARMEFRLHGLVPVVSASGPDTARSAAGRLAAETIAWLPGAATPQLGAAWSPVDDERATVTLTTPTGPIHVTVTVDLDGKLAAIDLQRWSDAAKPPALSAFGADLTDEFVTPDGVRIAGAGTVGWGHGTPTWSAGRFFEFRLTATAASRERVLPPGTTGSRQHDESDDLEVLP